MPPSLEFSGPSTVAAAQAALDYIVERLTVEVEADAVRELSYRIEAYRATGDTAALDGMGAWWNTVVTDLVLPALEDVADLAELTVERGLTAAGLNPVTLRKAVAEAAIRLAYIGDELSNVGDKLSDPELSELSSRQWARSVAASYGLAGGRTDVAIRTEVQGVMAKTRHTVAMDSPRRPTHHQWVAVMDDATRATHRVANGQVQPIGKPFQVGESQMMYPHAPGPASEVINCRCHEVFLYDEDDGE